MSAAGVVFVLSAIVLLALLATAIVLRVRVWSASDRAVRSSQVPSGPVAVGARHLGCGPTAVPAQLADWHVRGIVTVQPLEPTRAEDVSRDISGGPRWRLELGDTADLGPDERILLAGFFDEAAPRGTVVVLEQDDQSTRELILEAVGVARAMRDADGNVRVLGWLAVLIRVAAVLAFLAGFVAAAATLGAGAATGVFFAELVVMIVTLVLCARPVKPVASEREFRTQLRSMREFVRTARPDEVTPALLGWAMLWNLPGPWSDIAPDEVLELRWRERAFRPVGSLDMPVITD